MRYPIQDMRATQGQLGGRRFQALAVLGFPLFAPVAAGRFRNGHSEVGEHDVVDHFVLAGKGPTSQRRLTFRYLTIITFAGRDPMVVSPPVVWS